jgi:hypothetical protein
LGFSTNDQTIALTIDHLAQGNQQRINELVTIAERISNAMPLAPSIDNFIHSQQNNKDIETIGKLAIIQEILKAEKDSFLHEPDESVYKNTSESWLNYFFKDIFAQNTIDEVKFQINRIALIVFNYDRCIEHFLYRGLQTYYSLSPKISAEIVDSLEIYHPYGTAGRLPWSNKNIQSELTGFGESADQNKLLAMSKDIRTFTEIQHHSSVKPEMFSLIAKTIHDAKRIVFLGFAYHKLNMDLLMPKPIASRKNSLSKVSIFGTSRGISLSNLNEISDDLNKRLLSIGSIQIGQNGRQLTCSQLFQEYSRVLLS